MYGIIYKATNFINGKIYIGQTSLSLNERIIQHKKDSIRIKNRNITFYNAINKYGFENFNWCIIDQANSRGELDNKECFWIDYYKSYIHRENSNGYNMTLGGDGLYGYKPTKETIQKAIESRKWYKHSEETRTKQSLAHKGVLKTEEHKKKLSETKIGKNIKGNHPRARAIVQLDFNGNIIAEYPSVTDGAKAVDGNTTKISRCCAGAYRYRSHKNFIWIYKDDYTDEIVRNMINAVESKVKGRPTKSVIQFDLNGNYIRKFNSVKESYEYINGTKQGIINCCNGRIDEYKGFKWMYADEYEGEINV